MAPDELQRVDLNAVAIKADDVFAVAFLVHLARQILDGRIGGGWERSVHAVAAGPVRACVR